MRFTKNEDEGTAIITRRRLLRELMELPLSDWSRYHASDAEKNHGFYLNSSAVYGQIEVEPEEHVFDETPALFVNENRVSKASLLYARLSGNWTKGMVRKLTRALTRCPHSSWRHNPGSNSFSIHYKGDDIVVHRNWRNGVLEHELTINGLAIIGNWKPLSDKLSKNRFFLPFE